jgi:hypothetical protein
MEGTKTKCLSIPKVDRYEPFSASAVGLAESNYRKQINSTNST